MAILNRSAHGSRKSARQRRRPHRRAGMTLLELILALGLSIVVLGAVAMAINLFLRTLDARRSQVEETQIARAVLRMIADDLRGAVQQEKLDFSQAGSAASLASSAIADAAGAVGAAAGAAGGAGSTGGTTGSGGSSGGSSSSSSTKGGTGGGTSSGAGASGGSAGSSGAAGTPSTGGSSGGSAAGAQPSTASQDIEEATEPPPVPGVFGNQYQLQIDISRLPRIDELTMVQAPSSGSSITDMPSDIKTVAYYVRMAEAQPGTGFGGAAAGSALGREMRRPGLVRRQLDRAVTMYASQGGQSTNLQSKEQLVAPEVVGVEFRYFDGSQWLTSWDSIEQKRLPTAVEIIVAVQPGGEQFLGASGAAATTTAASSTAVQPLIFRQLVRLPAARTCPEPTTDESTDSSGATTETDPSGATGAGTGASAGSGTTSGS